MDADKLAVAEDRLAVQSQNLRDAMALLAKVDELEAALEVARQERDEANQALADAFNARDQATEAVQALQDGKPLGEVAGMHTIANQQRTIQRLTEENRQLSRRLKRQAWIEAREGEASLSELPA